MAHIMMLSDLYGRIGQILAEHGDAPIGYCKKPAGASEHNITLDWIEPIYCTVTHVTTDVDNVIIHTYELLLEKQND